MFLKVSALALGIAARSNCWAPPSFSTVSVLVSCPVTSSYVCEAPLGTCGFQSDFIFLVLSTW